MDFSDMDSQTLEYTHFLSSILKPGKILFVYVAKEMKSYDHLPEEYLNFRNQLVEDQKLTLKAKVNSVFGKSDVNYETKVVSGSPFDEVINLAIRETADLVIAGRKKESGGSGIVSERLSRNLPCNFLLVPEEQDKKMKKVLVITDFSDHSTLAMQRAMDVKRKDKEVEIIAHHSYSIPEDFAETGKSFEEFDDIMKRIADREMGRWLSKFDFSATIALTLNQEDSLATETIKLAKETESDLIIIGSKGQTLESLAELGSNTVKLMKADDSIPLLIVKKMGENLDILKAKGKG